VAMTNSIKLLENNIGVVSKDIERIYQQIRQMAQNQIKTMSLANQFQKDMLTTEGEKKKKDSDKSSSSSSDNLNDRRTLKNSLQGHDEHFTSQNSSVPKSRERKSPPVKSKSNPPRKMAKSNQFQVSKGNLRVKSPENNLPRTNKFNANRGSQHTTKMSNYENQQNVESFSGRGRMPVLKKEIYKMQNSKQI